MSSNETLADELISEMTHKNSNGKAAREMPWRPGHKEWGLAVVWIKPDLSDPKRLRRSCTDQMVQVFNRNYKLLFVPRTMFQRPLKRIFSVHLFTPGKWNWKELKKQCGKRQSFPSFFFVFVTKKPYRFVSDFFFCVKIDCMARLASGLGLVFHWK